MSDKVITVNASSQVLLDQKVNKLISGRNVKGIQNNQFRDGDKLMYSATVRMEEQSKRQLLLEG